MEKPHFHRHRQRLRERFLKSGIESFNDYEAVELLLTLAIPRKDVKIPAKLAIERFGSFRGVLDASLEELQKIPGIGEVAPAAIKFIREAAIRYLQPQSRADLSLKHPQPEIISLDQPQSLYDYCRAELGAQPHELFKVFYLDSRLHVLDVETLTEGTIDRAAVYPRTVMQKALQKNAAALIFAHNHPNEDVTPSEQDKILTRALVLASETLQIKVLDHLIVSKDIVFSFRKERLI
ncbi:MAG: DNA repair protein RadC [Candidatus Tectomicrobia bacterium]|nr:DNA repair protein RadC [Candidatus Tectomicrobia bacterium]